MTKLYRRVNPKRIADPGTDVTGIVGGGSSGIGDTLDHPGANQLVTTTGHSSKGSRIDDTHMLIAYSIATDGVAEVSALNTGTGVWSRPASAFTFDADVDVTYH